MTRSCKAPLAFAAIVAAGLLCWTARAQAPFDKLQRDQARAMLKDVHDALKKNYFDPDFRGVDIESRFKVEDAQLAKANSLGEAFTTIAGVLNELHDSHTFFLPPSRNVHREYGFVQQMIGDRCFITAVRPNRDASEKLALGDEVFAWEGNEPTRDNFKTLGYIFNTLLSLQKTTLRIRTPNGEERQVELTPKVIQEKKVLDIHNDNDLWKMIRDEENVEHEYRQRIVERGDALMVWKMPEFDLSDDEADRYLKQARKYSTLVMDLRGNPGGLVKTLERMVGGVMDHNVTIASRTGRRPGLKPTLAKSLGTYPGKLIVLIDSRSASAAELFARVVQLEHRGIVLGDRSAGAVMESRRYEFHQGVNTQFFYGVSITDADLTMSDGKSLERAGVKPDETILPTSADLAAGRDPVLARAAEMAGVGLDAAAAGKLFPIEWRKE